MKNSPAAGLFYANHNRRVVGASASMRWSTTGYIPPPLSVAQEVETRSSFHQDRTLRVTHALAAFGLATLLALAGVGAWTVASAGARPAGTIMTATMTADADESNSPTQVHGGCQCDHSSGAVCCCCSHCGCSSSTASGSQAAGMSNGSFRPTNGGNWDIDVGGAGTAGGGYCQCNGGCCCCSSCDCTGPGSRFINATINGNCNGVSNCNGDLPARQRRTLSDSIQARLQYELTRR